MRSFMEVVLGVVAVLVLCELLLRALPVATGLSYQPSSAQNPVVRGAPDSDYTFSIGWNMAGCVSSRPPQ